MGGMPINFQCPCCSSLPKGQQGLRDHLRNVHNIFHVEFAQISTFNPKIIHYKDEEGIRHAYEPRN